MRGSDILGGVTLGRSDPRMKRSDDRILTTHVGSIVRPEALLALANHQIGPQPAQACVAPIRA